MNPMIVNYSPLMNSRGDHNLQILKIYTHLRNQIYQIQQLAKKLNINKRYWYYYTCKYFSQYFNDFFSSMSLQSLTVYLFVQSKSQRVFSFSKTVQNINVIGIIFQLTFCLPVYILIEILLYYNIYLFAFFNMVSL